MAGLLAETRVSHLTLATGDVERLAEWYTETLGLVVHGREAGMVRLGGPDGEGFLTLAHLPGAQRQTQGRVGQKALVTGLYHFAILLPSRAALGQELGHLVEIGAAVSGASDHRVSEALYLSDPDGNGVEVTSDRPRTDWRWQDGLVTMTVDPLDLRGLLAEAGTMGKAWAGVPPGTRLGHVHLRVRDLEAAAAFYQDVLGFEATARYPGALFVAAGGYHHHFGLNTWESRNAPTPPPDAEGLRNVTIMLPDSAGLAAVAERLRDNNWKFTDRDGVLTVRDPSENTLRLAVNL